LEEETHYFKAKDTPFSWKIDLLGGIYEGWNPLNMMGEWHLME